MAAATAAVAAVALPHSTAPRPARSTAAVRSRPFHLESRLALPLPLPPNN